MIRNGPKRTIFTSAELEILSLYVHLTANITELNEKCMASRSTYDEPSIFDRMSPESFSSAFFPCINNTTKRVNHLCTSEVLHNH